MLQQWRDVGNTVSGLTGRDLNLTSPILEKNALPLNQLAGSSRGTELKLLFEKRALQSLNQVWEKKYRDYCFHLAFICSLLAFI